MQTVFTESKCIECDACVDICPTDTINFVTNDNEENLRKALKSVKIDKYANLFISQCSEGLKKRAALARLYYSFINKIDFWILDEPTNELDQSSRVLFQQLISKFLKQKGTVILASHDLNILEKKYNTIDLTLLNKRKIT